MSVEQLISNNLEEVSDALWQYLEADRANSQIVKTQLQLLLRVKGVVNLARPFIKTYAHNVQTNPALPSCLLRALQCYQDQATLQSSCAAVVLQYVNVMEALQSFVSKDGTWTADIQDVFVQLYESVNNNQFAILLQLMNVCQQKPAEVCTAEVNGMVENLVNGNMIVIKHGTRLMELLENAAPETAANKCFNKFYNWNTNVFFYITAHVIAPLVGLAGGVDWRNPQKAKWYALLYAAVKNVVDTYGQSQLAQLFADMFKPPEMRIHFTFNFFNLFAYSQTQKGYVLYYLDYLCKWNENLTLHVQHHYVMPLIQQVMTQLLAAAKSKYLQGSVGMLVGWLGSLFIPDIGDPLLYFADLLSYFMVTILLPTLLPYIMYYASTGVGKLFNMLEKQVNKNSRHMKYVLSSLPPSQNAASQQEDVQTLQYLDQVVNMNKRSWLYRTFKWCISALRKDVQKTMKARVVGYRCVRPQRRCVPVFSTDNLDRAMLYYTTAQRCKLKC